MKKLTHNITIGLSLLLFLISFQAEAKRTNTKKSKNINEEYDISSNHNVFIVNKFGKVNVSPWDQNSISLDITITVSQSNENKAQEILDNIEIDIKQTDEEFRVYTRIKNEKGQYFKLNSKRNTDLSIDYIVKLPRENQLSVKNSFGEVIIGPRNGNTKVDVNFGSATISDLTGENNDLRFQFSNPIIINNIGSAEIKLKHSNLDLIRSKDLVLTSEMSNIKIDRLEKGQVNLKLGTIEINEIKSLRLNSQMSTVKIDKIHDNANIKNNYGSLSINTISKAIKDLDISAEFSPINIQLERLGNYSIDAIAKMGDLQLPPNSIEDEKKYEEESMIQMNKGFKGRVGKKSDDASKIKIRNSFGEINISLTD